MLRDIVQDVGLSLSRTVLGAFDFRGRARIVDVGYYWAASMLLGLLIAPATDLLAWDVEWFVDRLVDVLLGLPFYGLLARRLHDQNRTAWWVLLTAPLLPINLFQSYRAVFAVVNPEWLSQPNPLDPWMPGLLVLALAVVVLMLLPGTRGPNRFGPDPRQAPEPVPA